MPMLGRKENIRKPTIIHKKGIIQASLREEKVNRIYLAILVVIFFGCASFSTIMIHPDGRQMVCQSSGGGGLGIAMAANSYSTCISSLQKAGFIEINKAGMAGVWFGTDSLARILKVIEKSPAEKSGIKAGDIIQEIDGTKIRSVGDAKVLIFGEAGTKRSLTILRDSLRIQFGITLASMSSTMNPNQSASENQNCNAIDDRAARFNCERSKRK
jgi:membrane-associated protease RseP (regulator of RpoE activity)